MVQQKTTTRNSNYKRKPHQNYQKKQTTNARPNYQKKRTTGPRPKTAAGTRPKRTARPPKAKENTLRIMALGGLEEVGRNMMLLEYNKDIVIIDMGLQFPEENMPGIDYIIPDVSYLEDKKDRIRGVIITHGHFDHIGAISHLIPKLGYPTIYTAKLTAALVKKRHEEYKNAQALKIQTIDPDSDMIKLGVFNIEFFRVNHSIPDSFGVVLGTPVGTVIHTGDFKIDLSPINDKPADLAKIALFGSRGVLALLSDSTDAPNKGNQLSESEITDNIETIFQESKGRIIVGTFASLINRVQQLLTLAEKYDRKVLLEGRSMNSNVEIAKQLGYLKFNPKTIIEEKEFRRLPDNKVMVVGTGAQGEQNAVLQRIANKDHKFLQIKRGDSLVFSSSVIPGNERTIQALKDVFYRQGAKVYHYQIMDIHSGGHAKQEDLKLLISLIKPKYLIPIEANHFMLRIHGEVGESVGIPKENIFVADNGQVMEFSRGQNQREITGRLTNEKIPTEYVFVDGLGVGDVQGIVIRDRQMMAEDGMFVVIAQIKRKTGELIGSPDIISRGFIYMKESRKLIEESRQLTRKICDHKGKKYDGDAMEVKNKLRKEIGNLLYKKTQRRPMILPVVLEV
ncbi:ribonuclease J [Candidatus Falkowbacteria bacterium]|jgi:ribonuclease J|nr:ribonuclease J [Candidatus Falkowbacteria bacterium]MBT7007535.1 ribonuclease J [Candidatus Falkowbacteria bacterium]